MSDGKRGEVAGSLGVGHGPGPAVGPLASGGAGHPGHVHLTSQDEGRTYKTPTARTGDGNSAELRGTGMSLLRGIWAVCGRMNNLQLRLVENRF